MSASEEAPGRAGQAPSECTDKELSAFLSQLGHSLQMVSALPSLIGDTAIPACARNACVDAFYIHASLLGHFFLNSPQHRIADDLVANHYLAHWELDRRSAKRYRSICDLASVHVIRSSRARVDTPVIDIDVADLRYEGHLLVESSRRFARQLESSGRRDDARAMDEFLVAVGSVPDRDPADGVGRRTASISTTGE